MVFMKGMCLITEHDGSSHTSVPVIVDYTANRIEAEIKREAQVESVRHDSSTSLPTVTSQVRTCYHTLLCRLHSAQYTYALLQVSPPPLVLLLIDSSLGVNRDEEAC